MYEIRCKTDCKVWITITREGVETQLTGVYSDPKGIADLMMREPLVEWPVAGHVVRFNPATAPKPVANTSPHLYHKRVTRVEVTNQENFDKLLVKPRAGDTFTSNLPGPGYKHAFRSGCKVFFDDQLNTTDLRELIHQRAVAVHYDNRSLTFWPADTKYHVTALDRDGDNRRVVATESWEEALDALIFGDGETA